MPNIAGQSLREVSELERFYHEAQRIRHDLDLLLRDLAAAIKPATRTSATDPVYISPITGKRHKIRRAK
jgi:hypothetical protein